VARVELARAKEIKPNPANMMLPLRAGGGVGKYVPPWVGMDTFIIQELSSSARAKGDWEVQSQRTEVEEKSRNVPVDAVELASTITVNEQGTGPLFHQRTVINT